VSLVIVGYAERRGAITVREESAICAAACETRGFHCDCHQGRRFDAADKPRVRP